MHAIRVDGGHFSRHLERMPAAAGYDVTMLLKQLIGPIAAATIVNAIWFAAIVIVAKSTYRVVVLFL